MKTSGKRTYNYVCKEAFKCDKEMSRRIREQAEAEGIKKSELIRQALSLRLNKKVIAAAKEEGLKPMELLNETFKGLSK